MVQIPGIQLFTKVLSPKAKPATATAIPTEEEQDLEALFESLEGFPEYDEKMFQHSAEEVLPELSVDADGLIKSLTNYLDNMRRTNRFFHNVSGFSQFHVSREEKQRPEVQQALQKLQLSLIERGTIDEALDLQRLHGLNADSVSAPGISSKLNSVLTEFVSTLNFEIFDECRSAFRPSLEILAPSLVLGGCAALERRRPEEVRAFLDQTGLVADDIIVDSAMKELSSLLNSGSSSTVVAATKLVDVFELPEDEVYRFAVNACVAHAVAQRVESTSVIRERFNLDARDLAVRALIIGKGEVAAAMLESAGLDLTLASLADRLPPFLSGLCESLELNTLEKLTSFIEKESEYVLFLSETPNTEPQLNARARRHADSLQIRLIEGEELQRSGISLAKLKAQGDKSHQLLFKALKKYSAGWQDNLLISGPFGRAAEVFGHKRMFDYINKTGLTRHDALEGIDSVLKLQERSGIAAEKFFHQVLRQVKMDGAEYGEGSAYAHLVALSQSFSGDPRETLELARSYSGIPKLSRLAKAFKRPTDVFRSWKDLRRFNELSGILRKREVLQDLSSLQSGPRKKLYEFIVHLAFHDSSQVNINSALNLFKDPLSVLSAGDQHSNQRLHDRKKPSNYVDIPNLDLSAEELVDSLVDGTLDQLQAHRPLMTTYAFPKDFVSIRASLSKALGSKRNGIRGAARSERKLFHESKKALKDTGVSVPDYIKGAEVPADVENALFALAYDEEIGMPAEYVRLIAKINRKSDPDGVVAGDDTGCCMRFGTGKNNVYSFNPNTSLFTVQLEVSPGKYRTIAQSVLTTDADLGVDIPKVVRALDGGSARVFEAVPDTLLSAEKAYLACDNIEVAYNYRDSDSLRYIEQVYRDFFTDYLSRYAEEDGLSAEVIPIGIAYTNLFASLPRERNTFAPLAPVSYSDKLGEEVYLLKPNDELLPTRGESAIAVVPDKPSEQIERSSVSELTFQDSLSTAYLEARAYSDNESLMEYLHNIENGLIAKDINNLRKGRPNLSLKHVDSNGRVDGYLIAYEGRENGELDGDRLIYVQDIATDGVNPGAGQALLLEFMDLIGEHYLEKGELLPIHAELRETTSFALVRKHQRGLERYLKRKFDIDVAFNVSVQETYSQGSDLMHRTVIKPIVVHH